MSFSGLSPPTYAAFPGTPAMLPAEAAFYQPPLLATPRSPQAPTHNPAHALALLLSTALYEHEHELHHLLPQVQWEDKSVERIYLGLNVPNFYIPPGWMLLFSGT